MSKDFEKDVTIAILDFVLAPVVILFVRFLITSVVEIRLNPNIEPFKLLFIAIVGTPLFILYFREKLTQ